VKDSLMQFFDRLKQVTVNTTRLYHPATIREKGVLWASGLGIVTLVIILYILSIIWSQEPDHFNIQANTQAQLGEEAKMVIGSHTTAALITAMETLLTKPGGYLSNDVMPPSVIMDNMPNWEFGALTQIRDLARSMRNDFSRSQTQSVENKDLAVAEPQFNFSNDSWLLPSSEGEYEKGLEALHHYLKGLSSKTKQNAQFYARADNLRDWLAIVEKRLGSLSQELSASVGQERMNTDLAGDAEAAQSTSTPSLVHVRTDWMLIDDKFYEARGATWALIHFLRAVEIDFKEILTKKNAVVSVQQIIRELESAQQPIYSPLVLNGGGFGVVTNYSLVMTSYISRANAAIIDLKNLLSDG